MSTVGKRRSQSVPIRRDASDCDRSAEWPAERFYWALLDLPVHSPASRSRASIAAPVPDGLLDDLAAKLPVPLDDLHAVAVNCSLVDASSNRRALLVCAVRKAELNGLDPCLLTLRPSSLPAALDPTTSRPAETPTVQVEGKSTARLLESLNLLIGPYEPKLHRRRRRRRHLLAAAWVGACAAVVGIGLHRQSAWNDRSAAEARLRTRRLLEPTPARSAADLAVLLERQRRMNQSAREIPPSTDVTPALSLMLAAWSRPADARTADSDPIMFGPPDPVLPPVVEVQSLTVQQDRATVTAIVSGGRTAARQGLAERILSDFRAPDGWTMEEPRWTHQATQTRLSFVLNRSKTQLMAGNQNGRVR